jgi:hypothetical protein
MNRDTDKVVTFAVTASGRRERVGNLSRTREPHRRIRPSSLFQSRSYGSHTGP